MKSTTIILINLVLMILANAAQALGQVAPAAPPPAATAPSTPAPSKAAPDKPAPRRDPSLGYNLAKGGAGPYAVRTVRTTLHDDERGRDVEILIRAPKLALDASGRPTDDSSFPLVVFSHGMGGSREAFEDLSERWASNGYVVVHPTHTDSLELRRKQGEAMPRPLETLRNSLSKVHPMDRRDDAAFVIDRVADVAAKADLPPRADGSPRIDAAHIGMAGHSAGALTTQLVAGVKARGGGTGHLVPASVGDPRVACAIVISGQGTSNRMFTKDSWSDLSMPMLVISGSNDYAGVGNETPESRREPFERAKPGDKYLLFMEGATHSSYQGKAKTMQFLGEKAPPDLAMIVDATASSTLAFLDAYLKSDANARAYLASEKLSQFGMGDIEFLRK